MKIGYPDKFSLDEYKDKYLWRYIDLFKLKDLISKEKIYFTRFDHFEDGVEGLTGKGVVLKALTRDKPLTKEDVNKSFDETTQNELIENDKNIRKTFLKLEEGQQTQFASCWFQGDRESMAMWKLYSKNDGVAIKFNAKELISSVIISAENFTNSDFKFLYLGPVEYKKIWPFDPTEIFDNKFSGLKKDKSYIHENEFRFVANVPESKKRRI